MAYIGNPVQQALTKVTSQSFNGTGSQTVFTLNRAVNTGEELEVFVENVQQEPGVGKSYTATGTTLTFDAAPQSGTGNIYVIYRGIAEVTRRLEHDPNQALAATTGTFSGAVSATSFSGDGSGLTGLGGGFPSGTKMLFGQTAAPTGWTKITTDDDAALRIVSGTVGSGGSSGLSTALATPTVTGTIAGSTGAHTLTSAEMPSHQHAHRQYTYQSGQGVKSVSSDQYRNSTIRFQTSAANGSAPTGGGGSHSHSLSATFSGGTAAINVKYVDVIMASKD